MTSNGWQMPGALAFVCPRYGTEVLGGAETVVREMAERLARRGLSVEILTTCAVDHYTWDNHYPPGEADVNGVLVRRFPIEKGNVRRYQMFGSQITSGTHLPLSQQEIWLNEGFRSARLYHYLMDNHERYHTVILTPYMFWTTYACSQIAPHKTVLRPCLHDEAFARLDIYKPMFRDSRGIIMNSRPEAELARSLFALPSNTDIVGEGIEPPGEANPERFRAKYGIDGDFLLYAGRREWGKNVDVLVEYFGEYLARTGSDVRLVLTGRGEVHIPAGLADKVIDLGFVTDEDRSDAFAAAAVVCQPSLWESFSRLIMEAWMGGTPVLAFSGCAVSTHHVRQAKGGLLYSDATDFMVALGVLLEQPELRRELGASGRAYVLENYRWDDVIDRLVDRLTAWAKDEVA